MRLIDANKLNKQLIPETCDSRRSKMKTIGYCKYVQLCPACTCRTCIYNAELLNITEDMDEADYCYRCDECEEYGEKIRGTEECEKYIASQEVLDCITQEKRKGFQIRNGGK